VSLEDGPYSADVRVAALYDVHGNLPALTAVLTELDAVRVEAIVVGGDVASGPMPAETLDALRARGALFVRGNADRVLDLRGAEDGEAFVRARRWVADRLGEERLEFLASLPLDLTLDVGELGAEYDVERAIAAILRSGYPRAGDVVPYLTRDVERPDRMSALIEAGPQA
jgi:Calcineurin-like phosphoesterase superfamily domain